MNPEHLQVVTGPENVLRGLSPHAINARKTHCPQNHEYTPENTRINSNGERVCIPCARTACLEWYYRQKEKTA